MSADQTQVKPVMIVAMTGAGAFEVNIEGSHDNINWQAWQGPYTSSIAKRLELGVRYWRTNIVANGGSVTSSVGPVPKLSGGWHSMNNPTITNASQT